MARSPESEPEPEPKTRAELMGSAIQARRNAIGRPDLLPRSSLTETRDDSTLRSPSELPAIKGHAIFRTRTTPPGFRS